MTNPIRSAQLQAAEELANSVKVLAAETRDIRRPSDTTALLSILRSVQDGLDGIYAGLADWHSHVEHGKHFAGIKEHSDLENPGWVRADIALREAEQYGADATAALERARSANQEAIWFDEIEDDDGN